MLQTQFENDNRQNALQNQVETRKQLANQNPGQIAHNQINQKIGDRIICPKCGHSFEATSALTEQIKAQMELEYLEKAKIKEDKLREEMNQKWSELDKKRQLEIETQKQKLIEEIASEKARIKQEGEAEKQKIEARIKAQIDLEMKDLQEQNLAHKKSLEEAGKRELEFRRQARELAEKQKNMELEIARKMDAERALIEEKIKADMEEKNRLSIMEKEKQLEQLRKSLDEANRKINQGSQQIQGDVQENDLKTILTSGFVFDTIEDVKTGIRGADLVQTVFSSFGNSCGKILWESKRTQRWSDDWVSKLKEDQTNIQADIAIIASQVVPDEIKNYGKYKGIWVVQYNSVYILALTATIRHFLEEIGHLKNSQIGMDQKMQYLYNYLTGSQFRNKIENIVEVFGNMKADLESEKRAMNKIWSKREKEISRVIDSTSSMYGDLQGIVGSQLQNIQTLELGGDL